MAPTSTSVHRMNVFVRRYPEVMRFELMRPNLKLFELQLTCTNVVFLGTFDVLPEISSPQHTTDPSLLSAQV